MAPPRSLRHPAQYVVGGFVLAAVVGAALLSIPAASEASGPAPLGVAVFTSAASVTLGGMAVVDTATYWTPFGQAVILVLIQIGGLGIVTGASVLFLVVTRQMGLRSRLAFQTETRALDLGGLRPLLVGILAFTFVFQALTALVLTARLWLGAGRSAGEALWQGGFHGISAFNNAGVSIFRGGLDDFTTDGWILVTIAVAVIAGGLGFPVWLELRRRPLAPGRWSLHTKLTLLATAALLVLGVGGLTAFEWSNPSTLGELSVPGKLLAGFFTGVMPRTAGFGAVDYSHVEPDSLLLTMMLMFAGGGSGSTAGGIKVTTFVLLILIVYAEVRGRSEVEAFRRQIPRPAQRQALTIAVLSINAIVLGALAVMATNSVGLAEALFECVAAGTTAGLSTGLTPELNGVGQGILILLMFLGRVGPLTLAVALVLRERERLYNHPEERPLVG